jgi:uncharacterized protein YndB with AHSA1/START domain
MATPTSCPDQVTLSVTLSSSPERVWHALTTGRARWWSEMHFEPRVGAALVETWVDPAGVTHESTGTVTLTEPDRRLGFDWIDAGWESPLTVELVMTPSAHGTQLFLVESGFSALADGARLHGEHRDGWAEHLGRLERAAATAA